MAAETIPNTSVFQEARNKVQSEIDQIYQCLEFKKVEMIAVIKELEDDYLSEQKQKQKKINEITALIEQTKQLTDNSLVEVRNRIIKDLRNELNKASIQESDDCSVEFEWGFSRDVITKINSITLKRLDTDKDEVSPPKKGPLRPPKPKLLLELKSTLQTRTMSRQRTHSYEKCKVVSCIETNPLEMIEPTSNQFQIRSNDKRGEMKSNFQRDARRSGRNFDRNLGGLQKNQGLYRSTPDIRNNTPDIRNVTNQGDDSFANRKLYWDKQATTSDASS